MFYYTPERIAIWAVRNNFGEKTKCPKCGTYAANLIHMFIECPELQTYWQKIGQVFYSKLGLGPSFTVPETMLSYKTDKPALG